MKFSILEDVTIATIFAMSVIFCRVGSLFMTLPGIGETYVAARFRLLLCLAISVLFAPLLVDRIPNAPDSVMQLFVILVIEIVVGVFLGAITRVLINTTQIAGMIISTQSALGSAMLFDPNQGGQGAMLGSFYTTMAVTLMFATDLHHVLIKGILESYIYFPVGKFIATGDLADMFSQTVTKSFEIAFKIAAPQIIVGLIMLLGSGILARIMPGMQVFFVLTPAQIMISFFLILITVSSVAMWNINVIGDYLSNFLLGR